MPVYKATMFIELGKAGWTESWYMTRNLAQVALPDLYALAFHRAKLFGTQTQISAIRVSNVDDDRDSILDVRAIVAQEPGTSAGNSDAAWTGYLIQTAAGPSHKKAWITRGQPDAWITRHGDNPPDPPPTLVNQVRLYTDQLVLFGMQIRAFASVGETPEWAIQAAVNAAGLTKFTINSHGLAIGDTVHVRKAKLRVGSIGKLNGDWFVTAVDGADVTVERPWTNLTYIGGGLARKRVVIYPSVVASTVIRAGKRDTGRPFFLTRGRR